MLAIRFKVDRESVIPMFRQLADQIRESIIKGDLPQGAKLPSHRELAKLLGISRSVVISAYNELQMDGFMETLSGSGSYVSRESGDVEEQAFESISWGTKLAPWIYDFKLSGSRECLCQFPADENTVHFEAGVPNLERMPVDLIGRVLSGLTPEELRSALSYPESPGRKELLKALTMRMDHSGLKLNPANLLLTTGTQNALYILFNALASPGEAVVMENPTYCTIQAVARMLHLRVISVDRNREGLDLTTLSNILKRVPVKFIYTMSNGHNPTGMNMSDQKKEILVRIAEKHSVPLIDDTVYSDMQYEKTASRTLCFFNKDNCVIEVGGISKTIAPGLRLGWIAASERLIHQLSTAIQAITIGVSGLSQLITEKLFTSSAYDKYLMEHMNFCAGVREGMVRACNRYLPSYVKANIPEAGFFFWLELPRGFDSWDILEMTSKKGVLFAPGSLFFFNGTGEEFVRLNFLYPGEKNMERGMKILGETIDEYAKKYTKLPKKADYIIV